MQDKEQVKNRFAEELGAEPMVTKVEKDGKPMFRVEYNSPGDRERFGVEFEAGKELAEEIQRVREELRR